MCCIIAVFKDDMRPSRQLVYKAMFKNDHGNGVAWIQDGQVHWHKGLEDEAVMEMAEKMPTPYFIHTRISTSGGKKANLCHPFPLEISPSLKMKGKAEAVLAHNGHVGSWDDILMATGFRQAQIKNGQWSDSRAIAHAVARSGNLDLLKNLGDSNRFAVLSAKTGRLSLFGTWIDEEDGVKISSTVTSYYAKTTYLNGRSVPAVANGTTTNRGGNWDGFHGQKESDKVKTVKEIKQITQASRASIGEKVEQKGDTRRTETGLVYGAAVMGLGTDEEMSMY